MNIQKIKFQYATPKSKYQKTKDAIYKIESEWHDYYSVDFQKNYFIENELEFYRQLKQDLEEELKNTNDKIKILEKK